MLKQFTSNVTGKEVTTQYTYEFDSKDRVTKMTLTNSDGNSITSFTYYD